MSKILRYKEYNKSEEISNEFIENLCNPQINESNEFKNYQSIAKKLAKDLKFNIGLILTFGTGVKLMIPIVQNLIDNSSLSIEMNTENLILLTITVVAITYLEETSNNVGDEINSSGNKSIVTKRDAQTLLEELKMRGIGQGIVKKLVSVFSVIGKFIKIVFRGTPYVLNGLLDIFGYTSLMIPFTNAISLFIGKYDLTIETITGNLLSLSIGVGAIISKRGVSWLVDKLKKSLNLKGFAKDLDIPVEVRPYDIIDNETDNLDKSKLIKEQ